jgi:hypothetical protein
VIDQTTDSFQRAYQKFLYTRNARPTVIRSDNAKAFESAEKMLKAIESTHGARWLFNPPRAPWWGGFYERLIGMIKGKMAYCFNRQKFQSYEDFTVAVAYLEYLINSRPIHTTRDPETGKEIYICPAQFINPGHPDNFDKNMANIIYPKAEETMSAKNLAERLMNQHKLLKRLHLIFETEYIDRLRKWHNNKMFDHQQQEQKKLEVGQLVLIKPEDNKFKGESPWQKLKWQLATVTDVEFTPTGRVRFADVEFENDGKTVVREQCAPQQFCVVELPRNKEEREKEVGEIKKKLTQPVTAADMPY